MTLMTSCSFASTGDSSNDSSNEVRILHYNIKELTTEKISSTTGDSSDQFISVKKVLADHDFDILSLNEVQYDLPGVPDSSFKSKGENLNLITRRLGLTHLSNNAFFPANTGENAKRKADGSYDANPNSPQARASADPVNFGTMPSQYSTGAIFKYQKVEEVIVKNLKWKDFNPNIDLSNFKDASGNAFHEDIKLFDKNFTDITVDVNGKNLHILLLHTVPSYHFGNKFSVNYIRNAEQLKFLEWYLTGKTEFPVNIPGIKPLSKEDYFVAIGDWNTEYNHPKNPGSEVLRRLFKKVQIWSKSPANLSFTSESGGFLPKPNRLMLDYIAYSHNIEILDFKIILPDFTRTELGCGAESNSSSEEAEIVTYKDGQKTCKSLVTSEYMHFKKASDHFPIWGHFKLK